MAMVQTRALNLGLLMFLAGCGAAQPPAIASPISSTGTSPPRAQASSPAPSVSTAAGDDQLRVSKAGWRTDFSKHTVPLSEIASGGPGKDGIPAVDRPKFVPLKEADAFLKAREQVVAVQNKGQARAYPIQILVWHEIVNDSLAGDPLTVTFCPLCNTAIAFDRRLNDQVLDFGTTGNLRNSDLVMYDRQTETWWQQAEGAGIVGQLAGQNLRFLPAELVSWEEFKKTFPDGVVLSRDTGFSRDYGRNPYQGYDAPDSKPFLFGGKTDSRLKPMERVLTISLGGQDKAYPFSALARKGIVNDEVAGQAVAVFFEKGAASPLDSSQIGDGRDIGTAAAFDPRLDGKKLTFSTKDGHIVDDGGGTWDIFGRASSGPYAGRSLAPVIAGTHFWFAWAAFKPATEIYKG
jgi:hypothetical protein